MKKTPPLHIQHAWRLANCLGDLQEFLWDAYSIDFLDHYFPEVTGLPLEPPPSPEDPLFVDDDIPF